tara:strand:- start:3835 stop:4272 length:438 start_codon:yes stop_codon:yes gene_type:complete
MKRVLVDEDLLEEMTTAGIVGYREGEYAYFEMSEPKTIAKPQRSRGLTALQQTALSNRNAQLNRFENTNFRGDVFSAAMSGRLSKPQASDRKIMSSGDNWKPMIWVKSSKDGVTGPGRWMPTKHNGKASFTNEERAQLTDYVDLQ